MPRLKYFNNTTQEWEYVIVGGQGPQGIQGEPGVISATDPIIYNAETQNVSLGSPDYITFDTTPETSSTTPGTIFWDNGEGTPTVVLNSNVNLNLGQENVALCYNSTGSTIANGSVVYISGAQGQRPSITLADADTEATSSKTFGMVTEDIADGNEGFVTTFGIVNGINTSTFTEGQALWLSQTAGQVNATRPLAPAHTVFIGYCLKSNATSGRIFVNPQNGYELNELHDVLIEETVADNELIARDAASGLWKNQTAAEAGLSEIGHTHDDRYYTETETNNLLNSKANLSGATFTGKIDSLGLGSESTVGAANGTGGLEIQSTSTKAASLSFHVPGLIATNMGVQPDQKFSIGGWSLPSDSLTIDLSGRVKTPNQPAFHYNSGGGSWTSGQVISFNNASYAINIGSNYNTTNMRFTAPIAGMYYFYVTMLSANDASAIDWRFYKNGSVFGAAGYTGAFASGYKQTNGFMLANLNANDYVDVRAFGTVGLHGDVVHNYFGGYLLG